MIILIPSETEDISAKINHHFCNAKYYIVLDTENDSWEVIEKKQKPRANVFEKAKEFKVEAVIVRHISEIAFNKLSELNVDIYESDDKMMKHAIEFFKRQKLKKLSKHNCNHPKIISC